MQASTLTRSSDVLAPLASIKRRRSAPLLRGNVAHQWSLDPSLTFLNHGSYGACPKGVLRAQAQIRERIERDPVRFYKVDLEPLMDGVREKLGAFLNCNPADLAMVRNATHALCTILKTCGLRPGDEILITEHEYGSLHNELERIVRETGAVVVKAPIPFPVTSPQQILENYLGLVSKRTRIAIISHVTSASALIFPVAPILRELASLGIDTVLDGAHSPGHIPTDISALAPTYFIGSGHKWISGPKGSAFMYVRPDKQAQFRPLAINARVHKVRPERALFLRDFDYQGTDDYSPILSIPAAIEAMGSLLPGGWPAIMRHNHEMIMAARDALLDLLGPDLMDPTPPCPESMVGSMATLLLPEPPEHMKSRPTQYDDALQDVLYDKYRIVVPIWRMGARNQRVVRISAHVYNTLEQYEYLARALRTELEAERR
jgi:isopenicillin-N epimerase